MMPQSMSQGQLQSSPISSPQQQQQASEAQSPHDACPRTILQRVRNSQNKQARIQCTQQSSGEEPGFWEKTAFTLLFLLISLFTDKLDWIFLCIFWVTGAESLRVSAGARLAPWGTPLPLRRLWRHSFILPVSSSLGSCAEVWRWGRRWGWVLMSSSLEQFPQTDWSCISPCVKQLLVAWVMSLSVFSLSHFSWAGAPGRPSPASAPRWGPGASASPAPDMGRSTACRLAGRPAGLPPEGC